MHINNALNEHVKLQRVETWNLMQMQLKQKGQQQGQAPSLASELEKLANELEKIVKLRDSGALTQKEFVEKKRMLAQVEVQLEAKKSAPKSNLIPR
jgi:hypothetical protein